MKLAQTKNNWYVYTSSGSMNASMSDVLDVLKKGDADSAKVFEGTDQNGEPMTFVVIKNNNP